MVSRVNGQCHISWLSWSPFGLTGYVFGAVQLTLLLADCYCSSHSGHFLDSSTFCNLQNPFFNMSLLLIPSSHLVHPLLLRIHESIVSAYSINCRLFGLSSLCKWVHLSSSISLSSSSFTHQQRNIPFRWNVSISVDVLRQSCQRHPGRELLCARCQYNALHCISPSDRCFNISCCSVGLVFYTVTLALLQTVTIRWNGFIGYALASGLQCDGWHRENHSSRSLYLCAKCNPLCSNYTHHSKSPDLCGNWQSIARSVSLLYHYE